MADLRIKLNHAAIKELLSSPEVARDLEQRARRIAAAAGPGHEVEMFQGRNRVRATIRTDTPEAAGHEAKHHTLISAVDAGR